MLNILTAFYHLVHDYPTNRVLQDPEVFGRAAQQYIVIQKLVDNLKPKWHHIFKVRTEVVRPVAPYLNPCEMQADSLKYLRLNTTEARKEVFLYELTRRKK